MHAGPAGRCGSVLGEIAGRSGSPRVQTRMTSHAIRRLVTPFALTLAVAIAPAAAQNAAEIDADNAKTRLIAEMIDL